MVKTNFSLHYDLGRYSQNIGVVGDINTGIYFVFHYSSIPAKLYFMIYQGYTNDILLIGNFQNIGAEYRICFLNQHSDTSPPSGWSHMPEFVEALQMNFSRMVILNVLALECVLSQYLMICQTYKNDILLFKRILE